MNTGVFILPIARRLGVSAFLRRLCALHVTLPWTLAATMLCRSVAADRCLADTDTAPSFMLSVAPYAMQTYAASVRSVDCFWTRKGGPTTTVLLIFMLHLQTHVKAPELTGWRRRLMSLLYRALLRRGSIARPCSRPRGRPDMRLLSLRAARHPPCSTDRRTYTSCSG
jgi:hypothetical protein